MYSPVYWIFILKDGLKEKELHSTRTERTNKRKRDHEEPKGKEHDGEEDPGHWRHFLCTYS